MRALRAATLVLALAGAASTLPGCAVAQPVPPPPPYDYGNDERPEYWEDHLDRYGEWRSVPQYGRVWYPYVGSGWRPYMYGYWAAGPSGWVWYSDEPWGFTFHYGRWALAPFGWVWVPGTVWAPAWVDWYWGSGFVAWAPLGFYGGIPWSYWVFVNDYDFGCRRIHTVHHWNHHHHDWWRHGRRGSPPRDHIIRVAHHPIVRVSERQLPDRTFTPRPQPGGRFESRPQGGGRTPSERSRGGFTSTPAPSRPQPSSPSREPGMRGFESVPQRPRPDAAPPSSRSPGFERIPRGNAGPRGYEDTLPGSGERPQGGFRPPAASPRVMQPPPPSIERPQGGFGRQPAPGYEGPRTAPPPGHGGDFRSVPGPSSPGGAPAPSAPGGAPSAPRGGGFSPGSVSPFSGPGGAGGGFLAPGSGSPGGFRGGARGSGSGRGGR